MGVVGHCAASGWASGETLLSDGGRHVVGRMVMFVVFGVSGLRDRPSSDA